MNYKKPTVWISIVAAIVVVAVIICFVFRNSDKDGMGTNLSEIAFDSLDLNANPGVGIRLVFESDRFIIFYGDFGLFGYDLKNREITFSVDFIKAFGKKGSVQGEYGTAVEVSHDGRNIVLTYTDPDNPEDVKDAYFIDVPTLTYTRGEYRPIENAFSRENAVGYIRTTGEIGTTLYIRGDKVWLVFDNYVPDVSK
ncbi:MAG TPA: hypothetical protein PLN81_10330 [Bacillota bacterium]|nr:hypothetical protein [Bacillota bacterium]